MLCTCVTHFCAKCPNNKKKNFPSEYACHDKLIKKHQRIFEDGI